MVKAQTVSFSNQIRLTHARRMKFAGSGVVVFRDLQNHQPGATLEILFPAGTATEIISPWDTQGDTFSAAVPCVLSLTAISATTIAAQLRRVELY